MRGVLTEVGLVLHDTLCFFALSTPKASPLQSYEILIRATSLTMSRLLNMPLLRNIAILEWE